ncbi:MAG: Lrp/AsnC ligand binding domain-containing protein [Salinivirgaceae bacterium]|jgi:Lrp/AsnC family transcriptional regulator for asnA, asnC and gidA|nr:Lrp/AsnC ligand binding domain-containing protein [Salinivirgaceae bacterium]
MAEHQHIDDLDKKILTLVSKNARVPYLEVARECNVSGAAIHQRIQRLIKMGVITGSEFIINPKSVGLSTCAYMGIYLQKAALFNEVLTKLKEIPEIVECHYTTGEYSLFIKVVTRDNEHLKDILGTRLQKIDGIERTETFISLEENFKRQFTIT